MPFNIKLLKIALPVATAVTAVAITATLLFSNRKDQKDNKEKEDVLLDDYEKELEKYEEQIIKTSSDEPEDRENTKDESTENTEDQQKIEQKIKEKLENPNKEELLETLLTNPKELIEKLSLEENIKLSEEQIKELAGKVEQLAKQGQEKQDGDSQTQGGPEGQPQEDGAQDAPNSIKEDKPSQPEGQLSEDTKNQSVTEEGPEQIPREEDPARGTKSHLEEESEILTKGEEEQDTITGKEENALQDGRIENSLSPMEEEESPLGPPEGLGATDSEVENEELSVDTLTEASEPRNEGQEDSDSSLSEGGGGENSEQGNDGGTGEFPLPLETLQALKGDVFSTLNSLRRIISN